MRAALSIAIATEPPEDEAELSRRARSLAGHTVGELGAALGSTLPADQRRAKGLVGRMVERALGARPGNRSGPDFERMGVELKTVPIRSDGRVRESTFVCSLPLLRIADSEWEGSSVHRKLRRVLWVPVEADGARPLARRRIGNAVFWSPDADQEATLRADWEDLVGAIGRGDAESLTAHVGRALQVRPKAATSHQRRRAAEADGGWVLTVPRGFYLRARFTEAALGAALHEAP